MKDFTITLTATSEKKFRLRAGSREEASLLVNAILENSDLLDFTDEDVNAVDIDVEEACGGVCELCGNACKNCGGCTDLESDCPYPEEDCEYRCPVCGGCMADEEDEDD